MVDIPERYELFNSIQTKEPSVVVIIDGLDKPLSSRALFTRVRYGDPNINYGDSGLVYGGLRRLTGSDGSDSFRDYLSLEGSSLTLDQRLEPEQGRGAVSTISLSFIDKGGYMSQVISPGVLLDDILGKSVKILLGYRQISYPEDYFTIFRGVVSGVTSQPGNVVLQLSDANIKRRQQLFYTATTKLSSAILAGDTTIPVVSNSDFHKQILGPDGTYDDAIKTYLIIEDEVIEYPATGFGSNQFISVNRGARGSTAVDHDIGTDVTCAVQIEDHGIDMALKLMLSGWNGSFETDVAVKNLVFTGDVDLGDQSQAIILPDGVNAVEDYGLSVGDYITVSNATNPSNNKTVQIIEFAELFDRPNQIIYTDDTFISEVDSPAVLALRSQYDTYPVTCGSKIPPKDVDVDGHIALKQLFLISEENSFRFYITEAESSGKTFLEKEIYLPMACYSYTRFGRLSVGITKPPIADDRLQFLSKDNILDPQNVQPQRSLNNRGFFNEIQFSWDANDSGDFTSVIKLLDSDSLSIIGLSSVLPIESKGARTDLGSNNQFQRRADFLLARYKRGAETMNLTVDWGTGNQIEAGDVIALVDNGELKITNLETGERNNSVKLYEVVRRTLDIKTGNVKLSLVSGIEGQATDRYGTISPSSLTDNGSTSASIRIQDSFGVIYPGNESRKWRDYIGEEIYIHSEDYSYEEVTTLIGIDSVDRYALLVNPALTGGAPPSGYIVDIPEYPDDPSPIFAAIYKQIHAFMDPTVPVITGLSDTEFEVSSGDVDKFFTGSIVRVHNDDWSIDSPEVFVVNINTTGNIIEVDGSLGFTPSGSEFVDLIGYHFDESGPYRMI